MTVAASEGDRGQLVPVALAQGLTPGHACRRPADLGQPDPGKGIVDAAGDRSARACDPCHTADSVRARGCGQGPPLTVDLVAANRASATLGPRVVIRELS